eukprot:s3310_g15.t1
MSKQDLQDDMSWLGVIIAQFTEFAVLAPSMQYCSAFLSSIHNSWGLCRWQNDMGIKVDGNAHVVLDLQAIWLFCSRLDLSKNHRDLATATFKAQLVTETPAIEMEKKCVFEHDRSFETLDQFLGFEKITLQIGALSITWKLVKNLEATCGLLQ